jgi:hypothetical protein
MTRRHDVLELLKLKLQELGVGVRNLHPAQLIQETFDFDGVRAAEPSAGPKNTRSSSRSVMS